MLKNCSRFKCEFSIPSLWCSFLSDGTAFTEQMITWNVPRVLPPLVPTPQITTLDVQMGVDGRKLDPATIHNRDYKLDVGPQLITVKIPVGADGGYYKVCRS